MSFRTRISFALNTRMQRAAFIGISHLVAFAENLGIWTFAQFHYDLELQYGA
jgi:hypothetical protein